MPIPPFSSALRQRELLESLTAMRTLGKSDELAERGVILGAERTVLDAVREVAKSLRIRDDLP